MTYETLLTFARKYGKPGIATYSCGGKMLVCDAIGALRGTRCTGELISVKWF